MNLLMDMENAGIYEKRHTVLKKKRKRCTDGLNNLNNSIDDVCHNYPHGATSVGSIPLESPVSISTGLVSLKVEDTTMEPAVTTSNELVRVPKRKIKKKKPKSRSNNASIVDDGCQDGALSESVVGINGKTSLERPTPSTDLSSSKKKKKKKKRKKKKNSDLEVAGSNATDVEEGSLTTEQQLGLTTENTGSLKVDHVLHGVKSCSGNSCPSDAITTSLETIPLGVHGVSTLAIEDIMTEKDANSPSVIPADKEEKKRKKKKKRGLKDRICGLNDISVCEGHLEKKGIELDEVHITRDDASNIEEDSSCKGNGSDNLTGGDPFGKSLEVHNILQEKGPSPDLDVLNDDINLEKGPSPYLDVLNGDVNIENAPSPDKEKKKRKKKKKRGLKDRICGLNDINVCEGHLERKGIELDEVHITRDDASNIEEDSSCKGNGSDNLTGGDTLCKPLEVDNILREKGPSPDLDVLNDDINLEKGPSPYLDVLNDDVNIQNAPSPDKEKKKRKKKKKRGLKDRICDLNEINVCEGHLEKKGIELDEVHITRDDASNIEEDSSCKGNGSDNLSGGDPLCNPLEVDNILQEKGPSPDLEAPSPDKEKKERKKQKKRGLKDRICGLNDINACEGHLEKKGIELDEVHITRDDASNIEEDSSCKGNGSDLSGGDPLCKPLEVENILREKGPSPVLDVLNDEINLEKGPSPYLDVLNDDVNIEKAPSPDLDVLNGDVNLDISVKEGELSQIDVSPERALVSHARKKLLILDVNGLLVDFVAYMPIGCKPDIVISKKAVFKRPYCDEFLQFCFDKFNVGVWSSRFKKNVDSVVHFLLGDSKHKLLFCWDQSHCTMTGFNTIEDRHKPLVLKELKKLWEKLEPDLPWERGDYDQTNTLLLDDSPYKALRNPVNTAIFPYSYDYRDFKDTSLGPGGDLRIYLEKLAVAENVQNYVEQNPFGQEAITESHPRWNFYCEILKSRR